MRSALALVLLVAVAASGCRRDPPPAPSVAATPAATAAPSSSTSPGSPALPADSAASAKPATTATGAVSVVESKPAPEAPAKPVGTYVQGTDGVTRMTISGLEIEVAADVPMRDKDAPRVAEGDNQVEITLRGWPIQAREGRIYVAGKSFGEAPAGSRVRIAKDGVYVGGELRGPLP